MPSTIADHKGFWTTLSLWNRWRDQTYQSDRETEKQYLDELPATSDARAPAAEQQAPAGAPIKEHFTLHSTGTHTVGGKGRMAGQSIKCSFWACKKEGCTRVASPWTRSLSATPSSFARRV